MLKNSKSVSIKMPSLEEDRAIRKAAKADPNAQPLKPNQLKAMVPISAVRGRPKQSNTKKLVSVRYSREVLEFFRATGEGWQSRMDGVLLAYVSRASNRSSRPAK
jgi:uncharacterized protein (DUF4415 family)